MIAKKTRTRRIILWTFLILIGLVILARLSMAPLINHSIVDWFEQQGLKAEVSQIIIYLQHGQIFIAGLKAEDDKGESLSLGQIEVVWSWSALWDNRFRIKTFKLQELDFSVERHSVEGLSIAGINLDKLAAADTEPTTAASAGGDKSEPLAWTFELQEFEISQLKSCYRSEQHDFCEGFEKLSWQGLVSIDFSRMDDAQLPINVDGDFILDNVKVRNNQLDRTMLGFDRFAIRDLKIETPMQIQSSEIALEALVMLERQVENEDPQITRLEGLRLNQFELSELSSLNVGEISIQGHKLTMVMLEDKRLEIEEWLETLPAQSEASSETEQTNPQSTQFQYQIGKFIYQTPDSLQYIDNSLPTPLQVALSEIELVIESIDSSRPDQPSQIKYSANIGEHGNINLEGTAVPLADKPSFDINGKLSGIDLRNLSSFTVDAIGHSIDSGQLDADLK
ncbi:MAG: DUF748 domain-containing protein, partial [Pseudomonadota bacterium]